jgi:hypothetical protein
MKFLKKILNAFKMQQLPPPYSQRISDEGIWRATYQSDFDTVEKTLKVFCSAFLLPFDERFKLTPDDRIYDIYKALYPNKWTPDTLEYEFLIKGMEKEFNFCFNDRELEGIETLKHLIEKAKAAQQGAEPDGCHNTGSRKMST